MSVRSISEMIEENTRSYLAAILFQYDFEPVRFQLVVVIVSANILLFSDAGDGTEIEWNVFRKGGEHLLSN